MAKNAIIFLSICLVINLVFEELPEIFYVNVTSSLPQGLYVKVPSQELNKGDYIVYDPPPEVKETIIKNGWGEGKHCFLKQVGAVAGEKYSIDGKTLAFEISGKYVGQVYEKDNVGNELPKLRGKFEVPLGYILPIATNARSFDGRYSGVIPKSRIKAKVTPILTW